MERDIDDDVKFYPVDKNFDWTYDEQKCADQGKMWYKVPQYPGICYDQSQYKIVVENQSEE